MQSSAKPSRPTRRSRRPRLLVSCEHGGNDVPAEYARLFDHATEILNSHRGLDYGALEVARAFAAALDAETLTSTTTRLLVDLNRSPYHKNVFSEFSRVLNRDERDAVMHAYYLPYRAKAERFVEAAVRAGAPVLHISSHSFTPALNGVTRRADIGLLYDPRRPLERRFAARWEREIESRRSDLVTRRNYPYRGTSDGLVTHLRRLPGAQIYSGLELEVNQKLVDAPGWSALVATLRDSLVAAVRAAQD